MFNNIIDDANMFQPESMLSSNIFDDPLFIIAVLACCGFALMGWFFGEQSKNTNNNEEVDSIENNTVDAVSDAVSETINNPDTYVQNDANTQTVRSDENGVIKRVIKTETVIEYCEEQPSAPKEISVRCPACGTINKVLEGSSTQCTSCLYTIQAVMR